MPRVRYATPERLLERLTDLRFLSVDFLNTFLLMYKVFTDGVTVLEALKKVYYDAEPPEASSAYSAAVAGNDPTSLVYASAKTQLIVAVFNARFLFQSVDKRLKNDTFRSRVAVCAVNGSRTWHGKTQFHVPSTERQFGLWFGDDRARTRSRTQRQLWYANAQAVLEIWRKF